MQAPEAEAVDCAIAIETPDTVQVPDALPTDAAYVGTAPAEIGPEAIGADDMPYQPNIYFRGPRKAEPSGLPEDSSGWQSGLPRQH